MGKQGTFFRNKSITKNWPGGRRNATVPVETKDEKDRTVTMFHVWNKRIVNIKAEWNDGVKSYLEPLPPPSEGGMAKPSDAPTTETPSEIRT